MIDKFKEWHRNSSSIRRVNAYSIVVCVVLALLVIGCFLFPPLVDAVLIISIIGTVAVSVWSVVFMCVMM